MGGMSLPHLILFGIIFLVLFGGRNKISEIMGDVAKGVKSFKKGLSDDDEVKPVSRPVDPPRTLDHYPAQQPAPRAETVTEPRNVG